MTPSDAARLRSPDTPKRVLVAGDTHGNTEWVLRHVLGQAKKHHCDLVLQVGDFGIWPGEGGQRYLNAINAAAERFNIPIHFIDGNHEDFEQLYALPLDEQGRRPVRSHVIHLPRGHRWEWGGVTCLAAGGATSIDVDYRLPMMTWWPQEAITQADIDACVAGGPATVLFTHDVQTEVEMPGNFKLTGIRPQVQAMAAQNRAALQMIVDEVRPALQFHGHWHERADRLVTRAVDGEPMRVVSLSCDNRASGSANGHCAVLDIEMLAADPINAARIID